MHITSEVRRRLLLFGLLWFVLTEAMRSLYRPWIYSNDYTDFHFADTVGSSFGAITSVLILPALLCRKKGTPVMRAAIGVWIGVVLYEFLQPLVKTGRFDWYDVIAATVGGGVGFLILNWVLQRRKQEDKPGELCSPEAVNTTHVEQSRSTGSGSARE